MAPGHLRNTLIIVAVALLALAAASCSAAATSQEKSTTFAPAQAGPSNLFLAVDMVQGTANVPKDVAKTKGCVLSSRFPRNGQIVWRARVFDPKTGQLMDDKGLSSVEVRLKDGTTLKMRYGPHPKDPPGESFWTASWITPKDHATGTLNYSVVATGTDGRTGEFAPFNTQPSLLTITDEVLPDVKG